MATLSHTLMHTLNASLRAVDTDIYKVYEKTSEQSFSDRSCCPSPRQCGLDGEVLAFI